MRPSVRQILLLTATTLAMVASCTPPIAWGQSFGQVKRVVEVLAVDEVNGTEELRITEQDFDAAGRVTASWSGPPIPGTELLDRSQARREAELTYEREGGRVLVESAGGLHGELPLYTYTYGYQAENRAPWADEVTFAESVPGETELVDTFTVSYARDALGRPVREQSSDGRVLDTAYDRFGGPIRVRSGAGATSSIGLDGRGLPVRQIRPNNRGGTTYAYDFDGRLLRQSTESAGETWERTYSYDATGRAERIDHEDGTFVGATYNPDGTMATRTTREGLIAFTYDAANRLQSVVPSGSLPESLVALDAGDFYEFDALSRPTEARRGSAGGGGVDAALSVAWSGYDLASRPAAESVGSRAPLGWRYDHWDRPVEVTLPAGVGRSPTGSFTGFRRQFDSLDRLSDVEGMGQLTSIALGAGWAWGGAARLYGITSRGPLGTAVRYGYIDGRGAQPPSGDGGASPWRLGTAQLGLGGSGGRCHPGAGCGVGSVRLRLARQRRRSQGWRQDGPGRRRSS